MVGDNDEKLVCQSFHLTGIDGNPLVSASIHIRYVERRREGINIATDIITDKKGVAEVALPVNGTGSFIISHGHYHCRGLINLDETDVSTKISFKGFKLVTASITCPDIPKNVKVNFRVSPQVVASAGQLSHLLILHRLSRIKSVFGKPGFMFPKELLTGVLVEILCTQ